MNMILNIDDFKNLMAKNGYNQTTLAQASNVSYVLINQLVNNKTKLTPKTAKKLATALNCSIEDFCTFSTK